ncbi:MAG TPA: pyridoxal phosphate-dependent aminotransferase [Phototrophicaceae bacterium]|nr:pyridoxal phosphate-dependent aminotransferase [Phototrophicaceae bacterium]
MVAKETLTSLEQPEYVVPADNRIPVNDYPAHMVDTPPSRMFLIRDALKVFRQNNATDPMFDASQGDGGASLPGVPTEILEKALKLQIDHGSAYDQPFGTAQFRKAAAEAYWGLKPESGWTGDNIIFVQGGRDGLQKAYSAMIALGSKEIGSVLVVSRVPWITYNWGAYNVGANIMRAPGLPEDGWRYTPDSIRLCAEVAARAGRKMAGIVITSPDNPTGRTIPVSEQIELAHTALDAGYPFVIFDWIYHWVTDGGHNDINVVLQAFSAEERERLMFLDGLTKSLGASNVRSAHLLAGKQVVKFIVSQASHGVIPAYFSQAVAIAAYEMGYEKAAASIIEPTKQSRKVLRAALEATGVRFVMGDGYYSFIDCAPYIEAGNLGDSEGLMTYLAEKYGIAVVAGKYFSDAGASWIRFSYALPPETTAGAVKRLFEGLNALK